MTTVQARTQASSPASSQDDDDERSLLQRLELLLEREDELLVARDAAGIAEVAEERERTAVRLGRLAHARRASLAFDPAADADLIELYRRVRHRHDVQAQVVRRHVEQNARAVGVLAQATGQPGLYQADGRVPLRFVAA